jgi:hypothetical protein
MNLAGTPGGDQTSWTGWIAFVPACPTTERHSNGSSAPATDSAPQLAGALGWFWTLDGMLDGRAPDSASARLRRLAAAVASKRSGARLARRIAGRTRGAGELAQEAVMLGRRSGDDVVIGCGLNALSVTQWALGDLEASTRTRHESLTAFEMADHNWGIALCQVLRARTAIDLADPDSASLAEAGLDAARGAGDLHLVGMGLEQVTRLALREGRTDTAVRNATDAVTVQERIATRRHRRPPPSG